MARNCIKRIYLLLAVHKKNPYKLTLTHVHTNKAIVFHRF